MPSSIFNPATGANSPVDGYVQHDIAGTAGGTWAALRDAAGNAASATAGDGTELVWLAAGTDSDRWNYITRGVFLFDLSSLVGATITAATFEVYVTSKINNLGGSHEVALVSSAPAANNALASTDYPSLGTTKFATNLTIAGISTSAYNAWVLDATGLAALSAGVVKLGLRLEKDRADTPPTWSSAAEAGIVGQYADGTNKPKLTVTYTTPSTGETGFAYFM